jgi:iron complex outermembrane receptor protein
MLAAFSPAAGVTFAAADNHNLYASLGSAYETPTTQELSNRPSGEGGFNPDLDPEVLRTFEGGARGLIDRLRLRYEVAAYVSTLENALVHYQRADEQDFFRNAGESSRKGVEALLVWEPSARLAARLAYTYQRFTFVRFVTDGGDYSGNQEPGAPPHQLLMGITHHLGFGLRSVAEFRRVARYPVDNANTFSNWPSNVIDLRFTWTRTWRRLNARPFLGIDNVFGERYNGSIIPNAFGGRYYEPSPGREVYVGLALGVGFP